MTNKTPTLNNLMGREQEMATPQALSSSSQSDSQDEQKDSSSKGKKKSSRPNCILDFFQIEGIYKALKDLEKNRGHTNFYNMLASAFFGISLSQFVEWYLTEGTSQRLRVSGFFLLIGFVFSLIPENKAKKRDNSIENLRGVIDGIFFKNPEILNAIKNIIHGKMRIQIVHPDSHF